MIAYRKNIHTMLWNVAALLLSAAFLFPLFWILLSSLKSDVEIFRSPPSFWPEKISFNAYTEQLSGKYSILLGAKNSFVISLASMSLSFVLAVPAAFGVSKFKLPFVRSILMFFLITQMLPASLVLAPLYLNFSTMGILNTYLAPILAITTITIPFTVLVLRPMFAGCPGELIEAAKIDGCNYFSAFLKVVLPTIRPGLVTVACFGFVHGWNDMVFSYTFNSESRLLPMTASLYNLMNEYGVRWNYIMAYGCILVLPTILIFVFAQRYIVGGLTAGAVKA